MKFWLLDYKKASAEAYQACRKADEEYIFNLVKESITQTKLILNKVLASHE